MTSAQALRQLAFIRYLFRVGVEQSRQPMPLAAAVLLTLHDAVELFLVLACEQLNCPATKENMPFAGYFESLRKQRGTDVSGEIAMMRLNKARVNLKHYGNLPATESVEGFRASVSAFFEDNCTNLFGTSFEAISMASLVEDAETRSHLEQAEASVAAGKGAEALTGVALAFDCLVRNFERRRARYRGKRSDWGAAAIHGFRVPPHTASRELNRFLRETAQALLNLEEIVRVLGLGIDIPRYWRYYEVAPKVLHMADGHVEVIAARENPQAEEVRFCFDFVVECALTMQAQLQSTVPKSEVVKYENGEVASDSSKNSPTGDA